MTHQQCGTVLPDEQAQDLLLAEDFRKFTAACRRERARRWVEFGHLGLTFELLNMYPSWTMTQADEPRTCVGCDREIPPGELHYLAPGGKAACNSECLHEKPE